MLTTRNMPKKRKVFDIDTKTAESISISDLPNRGRRREADQQRAVKERATPKILTISDLPRRTRDARKNSIVRSQPVQTLSTRRLLGPKVFADYVHNGAWNGRRCFIIGGGPSVKRLDLDMLRNELTIGINRAYELLSPSILFGVDGQLWGWAEQGKLGEESKRKFIAYDGYKVWMALHKVFPPDFYLIDVDDRGGDRIGSTRLLGFKSNSGYGAINLAAALGANPIYLVGFDMQGDKQGKQKWWHEGYPIDYGENIYKGYIEDINKFAPVLKRAGVDVVNLNPKSALKCFTFGKYEQVVATKPTIPAGAIRTMARPDMITVITPTGDRPLAFALCKHWMSRQTRKPDQWIVVDDGKTPLVPTAAMTYVRRSPKRRDPKHTLTVNMDAALPYIRGSRILIMEDDEYYGPGYIQQMSDELRNYEVVGMSHAKYYHLPSGGCHIIPNTLHASLAQTGFRSTFLPSVRKALSIKHEVYLDMRMWRTALAEQRGFLFADKADSLFVGMKGLSGRKGIGSGHNSAAYASKDITRGTLRKWVKKDAQVYLDILSGKLNDATCESYFRAITGITVCYNTKELMQRAYESVRHFHPEMPIVIVDGSDANDPCAAYVSGLASDLTTVVQPGHNIGHGEGMCLGINTAQTAYALIFDSDIEMLKSPVDAMFAMMEPDTYGVGYTEKSGMDGYEYGAHVHHAGQESMRMLHPYFQLLNIANYRKFHPYVHHGAPCYLAARDIHEQGLEHTIKEFPGLGHSSGKGWVWTGEPREYIRHDPAGTRHSRSAKGQSEIEGNWVRE